MRRWIAGLGGVVAGLVGTAGAARKGKSVGVSSIPFDDRRLFSMFSSLVVSARFARVGLAIADCPSWRAYLSSFAPERRLDLRVEATATVGTTSTVPTSRDALISPAEVISRCRLGSGDCGLLASEKPLTLVVVEAGGQLRLSRIVRDVERPCGVFDGSKWLKRAHRGDIALTTRTKLPSYIPISFELNKLGQR